ncbi:siderophore-interacting protein [Microbispora hainanensis]|uniref:siderophore-interacting protein n=1 Tax=Microbispora hainanensis TaxID=568844 RepID=UPI002E2BD5D0|nr:siderophore-interacting protein [Microbispora hainanensis]
MSVFLHGTVAEIEQITARMRRIRITGPGLRDLPWTPGTHIRLRVGDLRSPRSWLRGLLRTYSIWDYSAAGRLDLCILDHPSAGPGAQWSRRVRVGDPVALTSPDGRLVLREDAGYHLFAGDETATVAFGAMLRALPPSAIVHGAISVEGPGDHLPLNHADRLTWSCRPADRVDPAHLVDPGHLVDPTHLVDPAHLVDMVRSLELPDAPGVAYLAGEARSCQAVRLHLIRERGWPRRAVVVKPFWTPGRRGMD